MNTPEALLISELFPPTVGGSAVLLANIYGRLRDIDVSVLTDPVAGDIDIRDSFAQIVHVPMKQESWGILSRKTAGQYWTVARAIRSLAGKKRAIGYCARALPEGLAALIARRLFNGPPYVCWTHGEELVTYGTSRELSFLLRHVHRNAAAVIANSRNTQRMLEAVGVPASKIHVVYPGVDATRFGTARPAPLRNQLGWRDSLVLLSVGRLQRRKGHDLVIRTLATLRNDAPDVRYLIVGDGEERPRLEGLIREHGVGDLVRIVGTVPGEELPGYYAAGDIFVHPNRIDDGDIEGFGIVFLEAASAGLPAIGGNSGGVSEAIENEVTGLLVGGEDAGELAAAILRLARSPELRRSMGLAGRERVRQQFTWERAVAGVASLHMQLASSSWPESTGSASSSGHSRAASAQKVAL